MEANEFRFNLGSEVKDKITKFKGIVRARNQYLTGCNTYGVQAEGLDKDGVPKKWEWFDEEQLTLIKDKKVSYSYKKKIKAERKKRTKGGPHSPDQYPC